MFIFCKKEKNEYNKIKQIYNIKNKNMSLKNKYLSYEITTIPELDLVSYTQKNQKNFNMFELDNIYFKKTNTEKLNLINDILEWNYVIFDTETTWLNKFWESLPFQIAAKRYVNHKEVESLDLIINIWKVSDEILEMTGFTQADIDNWMSLNSALQKFLQFISNTKYVLAHNADFDVAIMNNVLVKENYYLKNKVYINCSMQLYYTVYKHIFKKNVIGSSLDQLALVLFWEVISDEKRHQADYDVELVNYLLVKIKEDIELDLKSKNSLINKALEIDEYLFEQNNILKNRNKDKDVISYVHDLGVKVYELYNDYLNIYSENLKITNAISNFVNERIDAWEKIILNDEYEQVKYYIRKNKPYRVVDARYTLTYNYIKTKIYLNSWEEIQFFFHEDDDFTDLYISNEEELAMYLNQVIDNRNTLLDLQIRINYILKMLKEHRKYSRFSNYGIDNKMIVFKDENTIGSIPRTVNKKTILEDYNKWLINSLEDLETINKLNTTLIIERNLTSLFDN